MSDDLLSLYDVSFPVPEGPAIPSYDALPPPHTAFSQRLDLAALRECRPNRFRSLRLIATRMVRRRGAVARFRRPRHVVRPPLASCSASPADRLLSSLDGGAIASSTAPR